MTVECWIPKGLNYTTTPTSGDRKRGHRDCKREDFYKVVFSHSVLSYGSQSFEINYSGFLFIFIIKILLFSVQKLFSVPDPLPQAIFSH